MRTALGRWRTLGGALLIAGCSQSQAEFGRAVKAVWPDVQTDARGSIYGFSDEHGFGRPHER